LKVGVGFLIVIEVSFLGMAEDLETSYGKISLIGGESTGLTIYEGGNCEGSGKRRSMSCGEGWW
jgi:hypothetical protein